VTESMSLTERYRRLLAWYPRDHRERHGEEMLGVLLAGAGERTRPSPGETADLVRGALRLHLRRVVGADGGIDHQDVFAIVSLVGPLVLLAGAAPLLDRLAGVLQSGAPLSWDRAVEDIPHAVVWGIWFAVAVLSMARLRRIAAAGAWLGTAGFLSVPSLGHTDFLDSVVPDTGWLLLGALVATALTWSPGPARGWQLVGGRIILLAGAIVTSVTLVMKTYGTYGVLFLPADWMLRGPAHLVVWGLALAWLVAGVVVAGGGRTREARRAALVLGVPVLVSVLMLLLPRHSHLLLVATVCYAVPLAVLLGFGGLPRRVSRA
jgi:hypothetical protein